MKKLFQPSFTSIYLRPNPGCQTAEKLSKKWRYRIAPPLNLPETMARASKLMRKRLDSSTQDNR
jgi:hypothetical protein